MTVSVALSVVFVVSWVLARVATENSPWISENILHRGGRTPRTAVSPMLDREGLLSKVAIDAEVANGTAMQAPDAETETEHSVAS